MPGSGSARHSRATRSCGGSANASLTATGGAQPSSLPRTTTTGQNAPVTQWMLTALLPSVLMLWSYNTATGLKVFTYLVALTVVTVAIPLPVLRLRATHLPGVQAPPGAGLGASQGPGHRRGRRAVLDVGHLRRRLPGRVPGAGGRPRRVVVYAFLKAYREHTGQIAAPTEKPPLEPAPGTGE